MLSQIITTISNSLKSKPILYLLILITQVVLLVCVYFSYGLIYNAYTNYQDASERDRSFSARLLDYYNETKTKDEIFADGISFDVFNTGMKKIFDYIGDTRYSVIVDGDIKLGDKYYYVSVYDDNLYSDKKHGPYDVSVNMDGYEVGDKIEIDGIKYNIVSDKSISELSFFSCESAPPSVIPCEVSIELEYQPTYEVSRKISDTILMYFNPIEMHEPEVLKLLDIQMNNTQIAMALVLLAISAANCCICYNYINESRRKTFAIYKLCGARDYHCLIISLAEVALYMALGCLCSYLIFEGFLKDILIGIYPNIMGVYTKDLYSDIFVKYALISLVIMIISIVKLATSPIVVERK